MRFSIMKKMFLIIFSLSLFLSCEKEKSVGMLKVPAGVPVIFVNTLPRPILTEHGYLLEIYWKAWELMQNNIHSGNLENGFVDSYLDEGFNELIYQWDTCFMALFAMYGGDLFPAMTSLDNFYKKQREDGWICRVYHEANGEAVEEPTGDEPMINPPLFAWVEWKYFLLTGDNSRFASVLPVLDAYYNWIDRNCKGQLAATGLYYTTPLGSGMDNSPREGIEKGGWMDLSAQMAMFAKYMMFMAREVQDEALIKIYEQRYRFLVRIINGKMWDNTSGFYYDITIRGQKIQVKTAASFWTLLSEVATFPQARRLAEHLQNPDEFYRNHLFPTLSAENPNYDSRGHYWRGGVWAPTDYMIIKGLDIFPLRELAARAALNHLENIYKVYQDFTPSSDEIAPDEESENYQTIWECYAPDFVQPATRWDGEYLSRQDFVGWSGLGPIALLLENVIGLQPSAPKDVLYWNLRLREMHGVENYRFGDNQIDIICESNELPVEAAQIRVNTNSPFKLIISSQVGVKEFNLETGENQFEVKL